MINLRPALSLAVSAFLVASGCSKPADQASEVAASNVSETATEAAPAPVAYASLSGNAAAGEAAFVQCKACHSMEEGKAMIGPSLHKVLGRTAGAIAGYTYSPALKASGIVWDEDKIFAYLEKPQTLVPGTKMSFAGIPDAQKRADLIAWLKANGGS